MWGLIDEHMMSVPQSSQTKVDEELFAQSVHPREEEALEEEEAAAALETQTQ